jgi:hypothetical protein
MSKFAYKRVEDYKASLPLLVEQLEFCNFTTDDGEHELKNNVAFHALKVLAEEWEPRKELVERAQLLLTRIMPPEIHGECEMCEELYNIIETLKL